MRAVAVRALVATCLAVTAVVVTAAPSVVEAAPNYGRYCASGAPIRSVATSQRVVAFTFDDGPWPANTASVMSSFERYGWRATFFMIGVNVQSYPDIARSVVSRGHGIAAHSMTHSYGVSTIAREAATSQALIQSVTGVRTSWFRSPGLTISSTIDQAVYAAGMCNISTGYDLGDWRSPRVSASTLCSRYRYALKPGAIILLHDGGSHKPTIDSLECMLSYTRQQGYQVVDLGDMLAGSYNGPAPAPPPPPPAPPSSGCQLSSLGSRGPNVVAAQRAVMNDSIYLRGGADGYFGSYTAAAVRTYQSRRGLTQTGAVDQATAGAMGLCASGTPAPPPPSGPVCQLSSLGNRGSAVVAAQRAVINSGIYLVGGADGYYGPYTAAAVARYQTARGLPASGTADEATAIAMGLFTPPAPPPTTTTTVAEATTAVAAAVAEDTTTTTTAPATTTTTTSTTTTTTSTSTTTTTTTTTTPPATSAIDGVVWHDDDGDGIRASAESPAGGVTVRLVGAGASALAETTTGADGAYRFSGLVTGDYHVEWVLPDGYTFSPGDVGTDDTVDSDTATVLTATPPAETVARAGVTLDGTDEVSNIDAGLVAVAPAPEAGG